MRWWIESFWRGAEGRDDEWAAATHWTLDCDWVDGVWGGRGGAWIIDESVGRRPEMAAGRAVQKNVVSEETEIDSHGVYPDLQVSVSPIISISSHHRVLSFLAVLFYAQECAQHRSIYLLRRRLHRHISKLRTMLRLKKHLKTFLLHEMYFCPLC